MKALHENKEAQKSISTSVQKWFEWCVENVTNHPEQKVLNADIAKISNKNVSVFLDVQDSNEKFRIYIDLAKWFVRGHMNGKTYNFSKKAMTNKRISKD